MNIPDQGSLNSIDWLEEPRKTSIHLNPGKARMISVPQNRGCVGLMSVFCVCLCVCVCMCVCVDMHNSHIMFNGANASPPTRLFFLHYSTLCFFIYSHI